VEALYRTNCEKRNKTDACICHLNCPMIDWQLQLVRNFFLILF
jgi:hypothetical protein